MMIENNQLHKPEGIRISVGVTAYNRPNFLRQAVLSVLQQSYDNFELIISNDYIAEPVTFETLGVENDSRIKIINQKINLGEVKNMNYMLNVASSNWFIWLADDDLLHPEFFMAANKCISENSEKEIVAYYSNYCQAENPTGIFPNECTSQDYFCYEPAYFVENYTSKNIDLIGCYGVMSRDILIKVGGFPLLGNAFSPYSDSLIPIQLSEFGNIFLTEEKLVFLRTHKDSLSVKSTDFTAYSSAEVDFLKHVKHISSKEILNLNQSKIISNVVRWFAKNNWAVLSRNTSLDLYSILKRFLMYQLKINLSRLSFKYKLFHLLFISYFIIKSLIYKLYKKLVLR
jgi:glycosyltransferase involved in cell wall biosynthesis